MIKEIIVVEGKDDVTAVKAAIDAEVITTHGFGYGPDLIKTLRKLVKRRGIIIFTDPDFVGEKIRRDLDSKIKGCKHAFLPQSKARKMLDIGIENARPEDIVLAIKKAKAVTIKAQNTYSKEDMLYFGLEGGKSSKALRDTLGHELGIGYGNAKQFLNKLNNFGVTKEEFIKAIERIKKNAK